MLGLFRGHRNLRGIGVKQTLSPESTRLLLLAYEGRRAPWLYGHLRQGQRTPPPSPCSFWEQEGRCTLAAQWVILDFIN